MLKNLFTTLLLTFYCLTSQAETSVWKVSFGGESIYIGGTVHLLRSSDFPLPAEFDIAYKRSDRIYFETDIAALTQPSTQQKMVMAMMAQPGNSIDKLLSPETLRKLSSALSKRGMALNSLKQFKASMIVTILQISELMRLGGTIEGVDTHFNGRATQDSKPTGELETVDDQLLFLSKMGEGKEDEFVRLSLRDLNQLELMYDNIIGAWRRGDLKQLEALFVGDMIRDYPEVYEQLLVQRNNNWLPKIKSMFKDPGTEYVLVGVAHLVGQNGILQRLEKQGYRVTPVSVK